MNTLLISSSDLIDDDLYEIKDSLRFGHLKNILKLKEGDPIKVCFINRGIGKGYITSIEKNHFKVSTKGSPFIKKSEPWCDLLIGLSRPQTCKKVLELGTSLGVNSFEFVKADLSEKSYGDSKIFQNKAYEEFILNGLSQSATFYKKPFFTLSSKINLDKYNDRTQKIVLSPYTNKSLNDVKLNFADPLTVAIGPERGWTKDELEYFRNNDFFEVSLSPSILRVETATVAILSQLELLKNENYGRINTGEVK
mgnify:CR=1 FL=1